MNHAVTLGVNKVNGKPVYTVLTDPNTPHNEQRRAFRDMRRESFGKYSEVQLWTSSSGLVKRQRTTDEVVGRMHVNESQSIPAASTSAGMSIPAAETSIPADLTARSNPSVVSVKKAAGIKQRKVTTNSLLD